jgi:hypothetical protein
MPALTNTADKFASYCTETLEHEYATKTMVLEDGYEERDGGSYELTQDERYDIEDELVELRAIIRNRPDTTWNR